MALFCHGHISRVLAMRWVGLPVANGGMILMNPAAITVLGTYHDAPCIEHANVVPFRPPQISQSTRIRRGVRGAAVASAAAGWGMPDAADPADRARRRARRRRPGLRAGRVRAAARAVPPHRRAAARGAVRADAGAVRPGRRTATTRTPANRSVGYALYFLNFSTWEGVHGIYLEDLYVRPDQRGAGWAGRCSPGWPRIADERGYARVEWSVLDWNAPSIAFYRSLGAEPMDGWTVFRLTGPACEGQRKRLIQAFAGLADQQISGDPAEQDRARPPAP